MAKGGLLSNTLESVAKRRYSMGMQPTELQSGVPAKKKKKKKVKNKNKSSVKVKTSKAKAKAQKEAIRRSVEDRVKKAKKKKTKPEGY